MMEKTEDARPIVPAEAIAEFVALLGEARVITTPVEIDEFRDPFWVPGDDTYIASAVVRPASTEDVQEVMRIANRYRLPVWPHSQGRNNGYGGASPRLAGSIQVRLESMNRVLEINEELAYAVVEPGVRWFDLYDALEAAGSSLMVSVPDLGWGSVIGNSMDNGMTYMPNGSNHVAPTGMEVVLPDGELLRTGMGAIPEGKAWHVYKRMLGPTLDGLFTQSSLGIVTKMGIWLQRKPEAYQSVFLTLKNHDDLAKGLDTMRELMLEGIVRGVPSFYPSPRNGALLLDLPVPVPRAWTEEQLQHYADEHIGRWAARIGLWEDADLVGPKLAKITREWEKIPGATVLPGRVYAPDEYHEITNQTEKVQIGIPTLQLMELTPPNIGHVGVSPVVPLRGAEVASVVETMRTIVTEAGVLFNGGVFLTGERHAIIVNGVQFDTTNEEETRRAYELAHRLVAAVGELGYGEYRAHLDFMDRAASMYSYNDHAYRRFVEKLKDAVDPHGILQPGRHGIWPAAYRDHRSV